MHQALMTLAIILPIGPMDEGPCCRVVATLIKAVPGTIAQAPTPPARLGDRSVAAPKYGALSVPAAGTSRKAANATASAPEPTVADPLALLKAARTVMRVVARSSPGVDSTPFRR